MADVLIAGCGKLGTALGLELVRRGLQVWGIRRDIDRLPPEIHPLHGDLARGSGLGALPREFEFVFYTAAAGSSDDDGYRRAYVDGPRAVLQALHAQGQRPRRVLFSSSTAVYHQQNGEWVDETSPTEPDSFRGARMLEGEAVFRRAPFSSCSVRLGGIYGPGRTRLLDAVRSGRTPLPANAPPVYTNRIHERDCVGILAHLMELPTVAPVYLGVDSHPAPRAEVIGWLAERVGVELPPAAAATGESRTWAGNKRCRNDLLLASGYRLRYPSYRDGYSELPG